MTTPTSEEQYLLELINDARLNPQASIERYLSSYSPLTATQASIRDALSYFGVSGDVLSSQLATLQSVSPLAWSAALGAAAAKHNLAMIAADEQSHQLPGEAALSTRVAAEGTAYSQVGENIYAYSADLLYAHAGFMVDWGYDAADYAGATLRPGFATIGDGIQDNISHRLNVMNSAFREVGVDVAFDNNAATDVGLLVVTQDFGASGTLYVTGVAYADRDGDRFYSLGEGRGDLIVKIGTATVTSYASGGYNMVASAGENTITYTGGGLAGTVTVKTVIGADNLKLDIVSGNTLVTSGSVTVEGAVSEIRALGTTGLTITAGAGGQTIYGTSGIDVLSGGAGNDVLIGGLGDDRLIGGDGRDTAVFSGRHIIYTVGTNKAGVTLIAGPSGNDLVEGVEVFRFSDGDFSLVDGVLTRIGQSTDNTAGYNVIQGTAGNDVLNGTDGADLLFGGAGNDAIHGGGGNDVAVYNGHLDEYTTATRGQFTIIIGKDSGTDTLDGVEIFRFKNGDFVKGADGVFTRYVDDSVLNQAPRVALSQNLSTVQGVSLKVTVIADDPDGDALTFVAQTPAHGSVASLGGGVFTYTPGKSFSGYDNFTVLVKDGKGGTVTQTVNIGVAKELTANEAPQVVTSQLASTTLGTPVSITIQATDPDGDAMTFVADGASHGSVKGGSTGVFVYQPLAGYTGFDSFDVTVSDGNGGMATLTVTVHIQQPSGGGGDTPVVNQPPIVDIAQTVILDAMGQAVITVKATDADGDPLSFVAGTSGQGTITGGANGVFTYVAKPEFGSQDKFTVTINDGKGGVATQEITILDTLPVYQLLLENGFKGSIGGNGAVFGTAGFQDITLFDAVGSYQLDGSFNQGGDIVRLPKAASAYKIHLTASSAVFDDGDTTYTIPLGSAGLPVVFADGVRKLAIDIGSGQAKIGSQTLTTTAASITALTDNTPLPSGVNPAAQSLMVLGEGSDVTVSGKYAIFGTQDNEHVRYLNGNLTLDGSFNQGGDVLHLSKAASAYSAYFVGSTVVLHSVDGNITIPVGVNGMTLDFAGDSRILKIDPTAGAIVIGSLPITGTSEGTATPLSGGGGGGSGDISLDDAPASVVTTINLESGKGHRIADDPDVNTNVIIKGMDQDDTIHVTRAARYSFTSAVKDGDGIANDLTITFNDGAHYATIEIRDILTPGPFVYNEATAEAAAGWNFITFG